MRVDFHTHIIPEELPNFIGKYGDGRWPVLEKTCSCGANIMIGGENFREVTNQVWSPTKRIEDMDKEGVDVQVLSPIPLMFAYWADIDQSLEMSQIQNDYIANAVKEHPTRFLGLGTVPMQDADVAIQEMERCMKELGLHGLEIGTNVNGENLDDPAFLPFFEKAEEWGVPLFIHPWESLGLDRMPRHNFMYTISYTTDTALAAASLIKGAVIEKFPNLKICLAHGGGSFPFLLPRLDQGWNVWPHLRQISKPPSYYAKNFYFDALMYDTLNLRYMMERFGYEKIMMGSDYPFLLREINPGKSIDETIGLTDEERQAILGKNALDFLNVDIKEFVNK